MREHRCRVCAAHLRCAFADLDAESREELTAVSRSFVYGSGFPLYRQGDEANGIYIVHAGWVKLAYSSEQGNGASVGLVGPGSVLGLPQVLSGTRHPAAAQVVQPSEFAFVERDHFLDFIDHHPRLTQRLLSLLSRELARVLSELCETAGKLPAQDRLLHVLEELARDCGQPSDDGVRIGIPLTVQDLADRIGCSRQWTSRLLGELEEAGKLGRRRGWYFLPSLDPRPGEVAEAFGFA